MFFDLIWQCYFVLIIGHSLEKYGIVGDQGGFVRNKLGFICTFLFVAFSWNQQQQKKGRKNPYKHVTTFGLKYW